MDDSQTAFATYPSYPFDFDMMKVRSLSRLTKDITHSFP